ncbi:acyltransferase family protein, partial [Eubacterium sp.]
MKNTLKPAKQSNRNYGIDLLRCVAMALVVMLHTLSRSGLLNNTPTHSLKYEVMWAMEIVAYCAVNVFIIISGYVGLKSRFKL